MKKKKPLVSVILTTYNSYRFLARSISSVLSQSYTNLELLIIDDCSTDRSIEIIRKYIKQDKRVKYYKTKKNSKLASIPRNIGIKNAKGKYLAFLDSDDYWEHNKIIYQISKIGNFDASFTASQYQKENSKKKSFILVNEIRIFLQKFFIKKVVNKGFFWLYVYNPFLISSAILKKKVFKNNLFDASLNLREDLNFWLNTFKNKKIKLIYHPKILLTITRAKKSVSHNKIEEFNRIINTISNNFFLNKNFDKFIYFLAGICLRSFKMFLSKYYMYVRKYIFLLLFLLSTCYFVIFYTPLFWKIGNNLIFYNDQKKTEALFVLSGHQGFDYWNNSYQERYYDIKSYINKFNNKNKVKFVLLGKLQSIPEQKILESLLLNENIPQENINVIYDEYKDSYNAIKLLYNNLEKLNVKSVTIITSPYHSLRLSKIWYKIPKNIKYEVVFFKHYKLPKKNNFFQRAYKKKEILYELMANFYEDFK